MADILKGYRRHVDQPPPLEREGCMPDDLAARARRGVPERRVGHVDGVAGCVGLWLRDAVEGM